MVISVHQEVGGVHLAVLDSIKRDNQELDKIRASLTKARRPELAGYYSSMAGYDSLGEARLNLIGWQIKAADVRATDSGTQIDLWLGGEGFDPDHFTIDDEPRDIDEESRRS
jgi:hypothetical protein